MLVMGMAAAMITGRISRSGLRARGSGCKDSRFADEKHDRSFQSLKVTIPIVHRQKRQNIRLKSWRYELHNGQNSAAKVVEGARYYRRG